jgi:hypothetical protein
MATLPGSKASLTKKQKYEKLAGQLKNDPMSFISHWKDLNDYILPRRGRFQLTDRNRGERRSKNIIDSTATFAARTLSSGMMSGITSPARPWFRLSTPDPDLGERASVKDWLHTVTQRMSTVFLQSNWYNILPTLYYDLGVFGTGAMMIEEDDEEVIRCTSFPVGSYYIANDSKGRVRVFVREFGMQVRQIVEKFGDNGNDLSKISTPVRNAWEQGSLDAWFDIVHVIAPNPEHDVNRLDSKYKAFASCYYERGNNDPELFLEEKGYDEFPVFVPRWSVTGEDVYATDCPGMTVLGDVKALQLGEKRSAQAMEKQLNPPLVGPTSLRNSKVSELPGDITWVDETVPNQLRPLHEVKPSLQDWEYRQERIRQRINEGMYANLFLMLAYTDPSRGKQPVTATEIAERQEEKLLALGPVLEQLNQDLLDPGIDRVFAIMVRMGLIPPPPEELVNVALKVEYISIMAQAQKMIGLSSLERFSGFVNSQLAATPNDPSILDKVDRDQMIDEYADMTGIPPRIIVPDEQVTAIRAQRAKAAEAERATAAAAQEARAAKDLSGARTGADNLLGQLLGGGNAGAGSIPGLAA